MNAADVRPRAYMRIAQRVLQGVNDGEWRQGDRLPSDRELASLSGVSRASAREGLLALELGGVIEVRHGEGAFVTGGQQALGTHAAALSEPPRDLIESRFYLEPVVAQLAATRISQDVLDGVRSNIDQAEALVADGASLGAFVLLGLRFHATVAMGCGNHFLTSVVRQLVNAEEHPLWLLVNQLVVNTVPVRQAQIREHRAIADAIERGDAEAARQAMADHLAGLERGLTVADGRGR